MTWGAYFMFYECPECGKKFRYELDDISEESFGRCPDRHVMGTFVGETKDIRQGENRFADYEYV